MSRTIVTTVPGDRQYASISEVAAYLGVHVKTVTRRIHDGTLTVYKLGRTMRLDLAEVDAAMMAKIPADDVS